MYCRQCHYDLRAQTTNRCPECGDTFDPNKPDTFYSEFPSIGWHLRTALKNFRESCVRNRGQIVIILFLFWGGFSFSVLLPSLPISGHFQGLRHSNLKVAMTAWILQQYNSPNAGLAFDKSIAPRAVRPALSPYTEYTRLCHQRQWKNLARMFPFTVVPLGCILFIVGLLWVGRIRRVVWIVSLLCLLSILIAFVPQFVSETLVPGTYAFLDDYEYLDVDLQPPKGDIAAYDWRSFRHDGERRVVAFDDGHVEAISDDRARQLFEKQGLPYPQPMESGQE